MSNSRLKRQSDLKRLNPTLFMITPGTELRIMSCSNEGFKQGSQVKLIRFLSKENYFLAETNLFSSRTLSNMNIENNGFFMLFKKLEGETFLQKRLQEE